jgi:hypothetical protein
LYEQGEEDPYDDLNRKEQIAMKKTVIASLTVALASTAIISGAMALGPQPEPPDKEVKSHVVGPVDWKNFSKGTLTPIPPSRAVKVRVK